MRGPVAAFAAVLMAVALGGAAASQEAPPPVSVLVVDFDAALRDSAAARAIRDAEIAARAELQERFDAMQQALEAEEARMVDLRRTMERADFDRLVVEFDTRVRAARRDAQQAGAALQARFAEAQAALAAAARPILDALMAERGAAVVIDRKATLAAAPALDVTDALLERLNARMPDAEGLLPPPAPLPPAPPAE